MCKLKARGDCSEDNDDSQAAALADFEAEMLERSAVKVQASADAAKFLHTSVAIQEGNVTRGAASKGAETG